MKKIKILALIVAVISLIFLLASCDNKDNSQTPDDKDVLGTTNGDLNYIINGDGSISIGSGSFGGNYVVDENGNLVGGAGQFVVDENGNITVVVGGNSQQGSFTGANYESYQNGIYTKGVLNETPSGWCGGGFCLTFDLGESIMNAAKAAPESNFNVNVSFKVSAANERSLLCAYIYTEKNSDNKFEIIKEAYSLKPSAFADFIGNFQIKGRDLQTDRLYLYVEGEEQDSTSTDEEYIIKNVKLIISPAS